jgi:splicing factor 3B subunit 2
MKERMQPKMGKIDIDYQILHDAFFKNQTKSHLTFHGDVYYEGKEYEVKMKVYKPGRISPDLCHALGIPESSPPPWLINMQRFGPPPAYPSLRIPGVNAPVPDSMHYGSGKYFTDERDFTVYADCHGLNQEVYTQRQEKRQRWAELAISDKEEDEVGSEDFSDLAKEDRISVGEYEDDSDIIEEEVPVDGSKSGITSVVNDVQIGGVDIRKAELKKKTEDLLSKTVPEETNETEGNAQLYQVLKEKKTDMQKGELVGIDHTYELPDKKKTQNGDEKKEEIKPPEPKKKTKSDKDKVKFKF